MLFPIFFGDNRAIDSALNYPSWVVRGKAIFLYTSDLCIFRTYEKMLSVVSAEYLVG